MRLKMRFNAVLSTLFLLLSMMLLFGCADSSTHGRESKKDIRSTVTVNNNGANSRVVFNTPVTVEGKEDSDMKQDTKGVATISPETKAMLTEGGSTGSMATDGSSPILKDIVSQIAPRTTTTQTTTPPVKPAATGTTPAGPAVSEEPDDVSVSTPQGDGSETTTDVGVGEKFTLSTSKDGYLTLRTKRLGPSFGSSIKFVYDNGYTVLIGDTTKRYEEGSRVTIYRSGAPGKLTGTSHGGMGIWTQKAGRSKNVIIYKIN